MAKEAEVDTTVTTPRRLLLVEDAAENRMLVGIYLRSTPHELESAENGREAVDLVTGGRGPFHLVFMDLRMPEMDGYEATRAIREWEETSNLSPVPIVALTATDDEEERQDALDAGCNAVVSKPIRKDTLLETIGRYALTPVSEEEGTG